MFTEQPAPPPTSAEIQQVEVAAPSAAPSASSRVAPPEAIATPIATPSPVAEPLPTPTPVQTAPQLDSSAADAAKAQRRQEVEQALTEITNKARVKQKEEQQQQAATEAAKYSESGDFDRAQKAVNNRTLSAKAKAALLKKLQAKKAKQDAIAQKRPGSSVQANQNSTTERISAPEYSGSHNSRVEYATAPIVPLSQAQMRVRLGKLFGRNLDFAFPLTVPVEVTSGFGWRVHPISGTPRFHRGIDLGAAMGSPIVAAKAGRVEAADSLSGYGLTVILRHPRAQQTLYAHMSQVFVRPGEQVKKGQLLGLVGSTGNSTGPHLHFELHEQTSEGWVALDPASALDAAIALAHSATSSKFNPVAIASRKPQSFNLSLSGLLDLNSLSPDLPDLPFVNPTIAKLLTPSPHPQRDITQAGMLLPFTFLPSAITADLSRLLSPLVDEFLAEVPLIPLPDFSDAQTISFNPIPTLANSSELATFNPPRPQPNLSTVRLATTQPLAGLTIAEQVPGAVRLGGMRNEERGVKREKLAMGNRR